MAHLALTFQLLDLPFEDGDVGFLVSECIGVKLEMSTSDLELLDGHVHASHVTTRTDEIGKHEHIDARTAAQVQDMTTCGGGGRGKMKEEGLHREKEEEERRRQKGSRTWRPVGEEGGTKEGK